MRKIVALIVMSTLIVSLPLPVLAQEPKPFYDRWELKFKNDAPQPYTCKSPLGERTNYYYMLFTVTNKTDENVPTRFSMSIVTETGKIYRNSLVPFAETEIIVKEQKLGGLVEGDQNEVIEKLKSEKRYLNVFEMDRTPFEPGETREGLAIFQELDRNADAFTLYVSGLVDPLNTTKEGDFVLENQVYCVDYFRAGDEFARHLDFVERKKDRWIVQDFGPIGDKELVRKLVETLATGEKELPKDVPEQDRIMQGRIIADLLKELTGLEGAEYDYDPSASMEEKEQVVKNWLAWWKANKYKLVWNQETRKYVIRETRME